MAARPADPVLGQRYALPVGACDCHCHVFGPTSKFPYPRDLRYTAPPDTSFANLGDLRRELGISRSVIVQATTYGLDNSCAADAIAQLRPNGRGIALIDETTTDKQLDALTAQGFVATRVGLTTSYGPNLDHLESVAKRLADIGWHMQFTMDVALLAHMGRRLDSLPVNLVFDHFGCSDPAAGVDESGFQFLLGMLREGRCWMKLSGPYKTSRSPAPLYADLQPRIDAMIEANPHRLLWASNWPHISSDGNPPNNTDLVDVLPAWLPDPVLRHRILVQNPEDLYGFDASAR